MDLKSLLNQITDETQRKDIEKWSKDPWGWKNEN